MKLPSAPRRMLSFATIVALSLAPATHIQGCTILGLAVGGMVDYRRNVGGPDRLLEVHPAAGAIVRPQTPQGEVAIRTG